VGRQGRRTRDLARANLAAVGISPRCLSTQEAAAYVGLSEKSFLVEVREGRYPSALPHKANRLLWDRRALDVAIDQLSGLVPPTFFEGVAAPNQAAMDTAIDNAIL
jgi:hypothetical protein